MKIPTMLTQAQKQNLAAGLYWLGNVQRNARYIKAAEEVLGSCKLPTGTCLPDVTKTDCDEYAGEFTEGGACDTGGGAPDPSAKACGCGGSCCQPGGKCAPFEWRGRWTPQQIAAAEAFADRHEAKMRAEPARRRTALQQQHAAAERAADLAEAKRDVEAEERVQRRRRIAAMR